jgi:hypothetical protein
MKILKGGLAKEDSSIMKELNTMNNSLLTSTEILNILEIELKILKGIKQKTQLRIL